MSDETSASPCFCKRKHHRRKNFANTIKENDRVLSVAAKEILGTLRQWKKNKALVTILSSNLESIKRSSASIQQLQKFPKIQKVNTNMFSDETSTSQFWHIATVWNSYSSICNSAFTIYWLTSNSNNGSRTTTIKIPIFLPFLTKNPQLCALCTSDTQPSNKSSISKALFWKYFERKAW